MCGLVTQAFHSFLLNLYVCHLVFVAFVFHSIIRVTGAVWISPGCRLIGFSLIPSVLWFSFVSFFFVFWWAQSNIWMNMVFFRSPQESFAIRCA